MLKSPILDTLTEEEYYMFDYIDIYPSNTIQIATPKVCQYEYRSISVMGLEISSIKSKDN